MPVEHTSQAEPTLTGASHNQLLVSWARLYGIPMDSLGATSVKPMGFETISLYGPHIIGRLNFLTSPVSRCPAKITPQFSTKADEPPCHDYDT